MRGLLKLLGVLILVLFLSGSGLYLWAGHRLQTDLETPHEYARTVATETEGGGDVGLGQRIVTIRNGCVDCHKPDLGGGVVIDDPGMGYIYAPNLTPAHLSRKLDTDIIRALRYGVNEQLKPLVFMPSHEYQNLSLSDMQAVVAYLRSVPPVDRPNQPIRVGPAGKVLYALGKLPPLLPAASGIIRQDSAFKEKPPEGPTVDHGQYLVEAGCQGCHRQDYSGGPIPGAPPDWLPATNLRAKGSAVSWTTDEFVAAIRTGKTPSGHMMRPPMPTQIMAQMSDDELTAMSLYFQHIGPLLTR